VLGNCKMKKNFNTILTILVLILAVLQAPLVYYYTFGMIALLIVPLYMLFGAILTIILLKRLFDGENKQKTKFEAVGSISALVVGISSIFLIGQIEKLDWHLRKSSRESIVEMVKRGELVPDNPYNNGVCPLKKWSFPPISNGGNDIVIYRGKNDVVTIKFYINRGFLDHYSAFVYTDDQSKIDELDERISWDTGDDKNLKLEKNWYRVSY
ncbi:hypothetical protein WJR50_34120, partial [Catalinimonas sp. 4WD22]|uniref:hypothetical protein n=1 Tax=Catalinimonas locisalis TaxID=3133978 RepID=UPI003100CA6D